MIEYLNSHLQSFWFLAGFSMLILDVIALGFSGFLIFAGVGALITGLLVQLQFIPATWLVSIPVFGMTSGISALILWKPMKKLQRDGLVENQSQSDFVGLRFRLDSDLNAEAPGKYRYSGVDWTVELSDASPENSLPSGTPVIVTNVDVGRFKVMKA